MVEAKVAAVTYQDVKRYDALFNITFRKMYQKFYPHFCGREDDVKQQMTIALIKAIRRMKQGVEIRNERNFIITAIKYETYKIAKELIDYDRFTNYLEDMRLCSFGYEIGWEDMIEGGVLSYDNLFASIKSKEDAYMVRIIIGDKGYTRYNLRAELKVGWPYMTELENRVVSRMKELIKRRVEMND